METNDRLELARDIVTRTGTSLFLTGKAGTGKTTFLHELRATCRKRMIVTAPTGIAAINAGGVTLHSFFQLDFGPFVPGMRRDNGNRRRHAFSKEKIRIIRGLDLLVIDEISMVRSDVLDAVDEVLRRYRDRSLPFGGVQLLLIGDLNQLPPVVTGAERHLLEANYKSPYFFDSHALAQLDYATVELQEVFRQRDDRFLSLLNAVRDNRADANVLRALNSRCRPGFSPDDSEGYIRLTTHNNLADGINRRRMAALPSPSHIFDASVTGTFPESSYPADPALELRIGAQVMFIKNDTGADRRYFNGLLGRVTDIEEDCVTVRPADGGEDIKVEPVEWENVKFVVNEETNEIKESVEGVFRQIPLRPAWAITIHKSQGLTFERAIIDASGAFSHGQTYVALSRCTTLDGLVLERPLDASAIITDRTVSDYLTGHRSEISDRDLDGMIRSYRLTLIEGMFSFRTIFNALEGVMRMLKENFQRLYPQQIALTSAKAEELRKSMSEVGERFCAQVRRIDGENDGKGNDGKLQGRIKDACRYFGELMQEFHELISAIPTEHDNHTVVQKLTERLELLAELEAVRSALLETFAYDDFDISRYHDVKARGAFRAQGGVKRKKGGKADCPKAEKTADNLNPELFEMLREWRSRIAAERGVPHFAVATTKALLGVSNMLPRNHAELLAVPGIGGASAASIGADLLRLVDEYMAGSHEGIAVRKEAKPKKSKRRKGDSARESLALWRGGMSVEDIAATRQLAVSTVIDHIIKTADLDNPAEKSRIIGDEKEKGLRSYYDGDPEVARPMTERIAEIAEAVGFTPTALQIRFVERCYPSIRRKPMEKPE